MHLEPTPNEHVTSIHPSMVGYSKKRDGNVKQLSAIKRFLSKNRHWTKCFVVAFASWFVSLAMTRPLADKKLISRFSREFSNTRVSRYCDFAGNVKASWGSSWLVICLLYEERWWRLTKINFTIKVKAVGPDFPAMRCWDRGRSRGKVSDVGRCRLGSDERLWVDRI